MLLGLMSRWMMPCLCASSSASATSRPRSIGFLQGEHLRRVGDDVGQRPAADELEHDVGLTLVLQDFVDLADVRMIQLGDRRGLAQEPLLRRFVLRVVGLQRLDRDRARQLRVERLVHDAHASATDLLDDLVAPDRLPNHGHHSWSAVAKHARRADRQTTVS